MEIEDLRTFVEVADAGGITPAANRLGVSKSVVSRRLARLEESLGVQLMARTTRGAGLTEAGITFRGYASRVCAEIDQAKETILPAGNLLGQFRIAAPLSFGPIHFAPIFAEMARRHPELHIHASYSDRFVDLIAEGFDCAVRVGHMPDSNLLARRVGPIYGRFVASPDYIKKHGAPETPEELLNHEALMQGTETWHVVSGDETISINPRGRFKADNGVALVAAALAGIGVAVLPDGLMTEHLASGALVPVMTRYPIAPAAIYVVRPPGQQEPSRKIRLLTELLIECFGQEQRVGEGGGPSGRPNDS